MDDVPLWPEGSTCKPSADVGSGRGAALSPTKTIAPVIRKVLSSAEKTSFGNGRSLSGGSQGVEMPVIGLGAAHFGDTTTATVAEWIKSGGRAIDTSVRHRHRHTTQTQVAQRLFLNCLVLCARRTTATASTPPSG